VKHDLGFTRVRLGRIAGWRAMFNYWGRDAVTSEDIHGHRWDFISIVLRGSLTEEIWDSQPGEEMDLYYCVPHTGHTAPEPSGTCDLSLRRSVTRKAPAIYTGRASEFHRVIVDKAPALTLFIKKPGVDIDVYAARPRSLA